MATYPISVLIPTMNRPESLRRTLQSYFDGTYIPGQFVVVDQSQGELRQQVQAVAESFAGVEYYYQQIPSSTLARNEAFRHAREEIIIYSDDDIDVRRNTVQTIAALMEDKNLAMISGMNDLSPVGNGKIGYLLGEKTWSKRKMGHVTPSMLGRFPVGLTRGETTAMWAMGFFFAVRKSLAEKYGSHWDENLIGYAYAEDLDYSMTYYEHARQDGLRCIFHADVHVGHLGSLEYRVPSEKSIYSYMVNRWYLSYKHGYGVSSRIAMCWCDFFKLLHRIARRNQPLTFAKAWGYAIRTRKQLKQGIVKYPF